MADQTSGLVVYSKNYPDPMPYQYLIFPLTGRRELHDDKYLERLIAGPAYTEVAKGRCADLKRSNGSDDWDPGDYLIRFSPAEHNLLKKSKLRLGHQPNCVHCKRFVSTGRNPTRAPNGCYHLGTCLTPAVVVELKKLRMTQNEKHAKKASRMRSSSALEGAVSSLCLKLEALETVIE